LGSPGSATKDERTGHGTHQDGGWLDLGKRRAYARAFLVPGMNHCSRGPATDRFDMSGRLVDWIESKTLALEAVVASARGATPPARPKF
jgi:hypothetical protein